MEKKVIPSNRFWNIFLYFDFFFEALWTGGGVCYVAHRRAHKDRENRNKNENEKKNHNCKTCNTQLAIKCEQFFMVWAQMCVRARVRFHSWNRIYKFLVSKMCARIIGINCLSNLLRYAPDIYEINCECRWDRVGERKEKRGVHVLCTHKHTTKFSFFLSLLKIIKQFCLIDSDVDDDIRDSKSSVKFKHFNNFWCLVIWHTAC